MQEEHYLKELFSKYREGRLTAQEKQLIARWLVQLNIDQNGVAENWAANQQRSIAALKAHLFQETLQTKAHITEVLNPSQNSTEILHVPKGISQTIPPQKSIQHTTTSSKVIRLSTWLRSAVAGIIVLCSVGAAVYLIRSNHLKHTPVLAYEQLSTQAGEMKIITLTDGTRITLNNQSQLKYPKNFDGPTREVYLTGEAFFDVKQDPDKPFKVLTDQVNIHVLGTSFDIQAYPDEPLLSVTVATGKIGVLPNHSIDHQTHILLPGEQLNYNRTNAVFNQLKMEPANASAWRQGILVFHNETMEHITRRLERSYKVKFRFQNKALATKQFSLKAENPGLEQVMKALSIAGDFNYRIEKDRVTLW